VTDTDEVPAGIDASVATPARMYDYWLGGHNNFAADRIAAQRVLEIWPEAPLVARENRSFLGRAVRFLVAEAGIRQFLDLGTGLPASGSVHEVAQAIEPESRVIYVDNDPMVLAHARSLKTGNRAAVLRADLRDTAAILTHPDTRRLIDFAKPLAVLFVAVLHFVDDPEAHQAVARFRDSAPPGSYLVLSHGTVEDEVDPDLAAASTAAYAKTASPIFTRPRAEILDFFGDWEIIEPGLVPVMQWRPDQPGAATDDLPLPVRAVQGAVARKPS
jgi:S-adenosyl methyltransferase